MSVFKQAEILFSGPTAAEVYSVLLHGRTGSGCGGGHGRVLVADSAPPAGAGTVTRQHSYPAHYTSQLLSQARVAVAVIFLSGLPLTAGIFDSPLA